VGLVAGLCQVRDVVAPLRLGHALCPGVLVELPVGIAADQAVLYLHGKPPSSSLDMPSSRQKTSSLCSPRSGARLRTSQGLSLNRYGAPAYSKDLPSSGCSTETKNPRARRCSSSSVSSGARTGPQTIPRRCDPWYSSSDGLVAQNAAST